MNNSGQFLSWNANEADTQPKSWSGKSPLLLEANAGTGKTYSLVRIVKRLIQQGIELQNIVILTFTQKAAREMRERLHDFLTKESEGPNRDKFIPALQQLSYSQIVTIHSFCFWIIRQFPEVFGISQDIKLLSSKELITNLVTNYLRQTALNLNHDQPTQVELAELKNKIVGVVDHNQALLSKSFEYISYQDKDKNKLCDFYHAASVDFDSSLADKMRGQNLSYQGMIRLVYDKVVEVSKNQQPSDLVLKLRSRFKACVVDEFQDTDLYQWEIVKSIFELEKNPVVVIGDPKQSIYAFRGADIRVYQKAKEEIKKAGGVWARLTTNYRTVKSLLEKTNWLSAAFFHETGENWGRLTYQKEENEWSRPCDEQDLKIRWVDKSANEPPTLQWIKCVDSKISIAQVREQFIKGIVEAIPQLIGRLVEVKSEGGWKIRPLAYSDIVVLADQNKTLKKINKELTQNGIPSIVVGKGDIWQSEAAHELHRLFRFLERPTDFSRRRALLSGVWAQNDLHDIDQEQSELNVFLEQYLRQGLEFYAQRQFTALIGWVSLWSPDWLVKLLTQNRGERLLTDLFHLMDLATEAATNRVFQSKTPLEWVEQNFSSPTGSEEIEDLRLDKSSDAVRLLTLHNSKGLEFPVVFLMYGLAEESTNTKYVQNGLAIYRGESEGLDKGLWWFADRVGDFEKVQLVNSRSHQGKDLKEKITQDKKLEEKRLWYVGITRAQLALFLPDKLSNTPVKAKIQHFFDWVEAFKKNLGGQESEEFEQIFNPQQPKQNTIQDLGAPLIQTSFKTDLLQLNYDCPLPLITSYSTEHRKRQRQPQKEMENAESRETDESAFSADDTDLFAGAWFGNLFHKAMELWNWKGNPDPKTFLSSPNFALILNENAPQEIDHEKLLNYLKDLMTNTLKVKLEGLGCALEHLDLKQLKKEITFLNHESDKHRFVKGVIDVLVLLKNQFYIIDYKTNLLKDYAPDSLKQAMQDNDYTLQAQFYAQAVKKHLKNLTGSNYHFGGCLYLFVRALNITSQGLGQFFIQGD